MIRALITGGAGFIGSAITDTSAKQCALLEVQGILNEYALIISEFGRPIEIDARFYHWQQVKQAIKDM